MRAAEMQKGDREGSEGISLDAWLSYLQSEAAAAENVRLAYAGITLGLIMAIAGIAITNLDEWIFWASSILIIVVTISGVIWVNRRQSRMELARKLVNEIVTGVITKPEEVAVVWKWHRGYRLP
jgi:hypothetical protein